jgi:hypothetical protein
MKGDEAADSAACVVVAAIRLRENSTAAMGRVLHYDNVRLQDLAPFRPRSQLLIALSFICGVTMHAV